MHYCQSSNDSLSEQAGAWGGGSVHFPPFLLNVRPDTVGTSSEQGLVFLFSLPTSPRWGGVQVWGLFPLWFQ